MFSGSGVTLGITGLSALCLTGVAGEGFLNIAGFLRLIRRRICHSRIHLLHQIEHVNMLSTDVSAKSTSKSSNVMMMIFFGSQKRFCSSSCVFFLLVFSIVCLI